MEGIKYRFMFDATTNVLWPMVIHDLPAQGLTSVFTLDVAQNIYERMPNFSVWTLEVFMTRYLAIVVSFLMSCIFGEVHSVV